ncbi:hypothetical protein AHAS_Ahas20G0136300 [Arachis hypogaea]
MQAKVPRNFKIPDNDLYDGTTDPRHHLSNFKSRMYLVDASDAIHSKVLTQLNCAPSQLHPNSWAFLWAYECLMQFLEFPSSLNIFFLLFQSKCV